MKLRTIIGIGLLAASALVLMIAPSAASADPNTQTQLPADGVLSITRDGDVWTLTADGVPSEVKLMSPRNEVLCGVNYGRACGTTTTVTVASDCTYWQVDGLPGHNSSDPFVCLGGTPSTSPSPTEPPASSEPPATVPPTLPSSSGPSTEAPSPSPSETSSPTSMPEPSSVPSPATTDAASATTYMPIGQKPQSASAPARLADTGAASQLWLALGVALGLAGLPMLTTNLITKRKARR